MIHCTVVKNLGGKERCFLIPNHRVYALICQRCSLVKTRIRLLSEKEAVVDIAESFLA